ncbi:hypothetical protein JVT61DRAFT_6122 [Boletus reticuloceps]|uniref:Uncharacterized protein n=1 Tax=Boletus reticuloceps TaxID=495285 RepID=A0A8I2YMQ3_9AGAM|nr:hypothetical protein JVT61DRAFT_6122 [Boletus reticuloceps]
MLAQFFTGFQELTSWSFSMLMGGPLPENRGKVEACSLHVGMTNLGSTFFNNGIMRPYKEFLNCVPASTSTGYNESIVPSHEASWTPPLTLDSPVIATIPGAFPPIMPDDLPVITTSPDTHTYNYCPQTAIDPLDQFLAKYPPGCAATSPLIPQYVQRDWQQSGHI